MNETLQVIFGLLGGLALFLFGMNNMSDALQKAAGDKMRKVLGFLTKNPIMGALAGALVTAVLQSSSATTVMAIGFVSSGLMSLPQAISVIFGANIGTTMTAQLMTLKITDYIYPIIFIGFIIYFICKNEKAKNIGMVILSFGLLFEGIEIMGGVMKPLASSHVFIDLMGQVSDLPVLGVLLGAAMTVTVQSSSATIAVLQNFASQAGPDGVTSIIGIAGAIPILLGDNIGTTITALLASIGQSRNAKRTAIAHTVFNVSGTVLCLIVLPLFTKLIVAISPKGDEVDVISNQIANAHTVFNVSCTLIWLPLIPIMVKIVTFIIRGNDSLERPLSVPQYLDEKVFGQPSAAMFLISEEIRRSCSYVKSMIKAMGRELSGLEPLESKKDFDESMATVKSLQGHISTYIEKLFAAGTLNENQSGQTAGLLYISNNLDKIANRCNDIDSIVSKIEIQKFSDDAKAELAKCVDLSEDLFDLAYEAVDQGNPDTSQEVFDIKKQLRKLQKKSKKAHIARLQSKKCTESRASEYNHILYDLELLTYDCVGIAEEVLDGVSLIKLSPDEIEETVLLEGGEEC